MRFCCPALDFFPQAALLSSKALCFASFFSSRRSFLQKVTLSWWTFLSGKIFCNCKRALSFVVKACVSVLYSGASPGIEGTGRDSVCTHHQMAALLWHRESVNYPAPRSRYRRHAGYCSYIPKTVISSRLIVMYVKEKKPTYQ